MKYLLLGAGNTAIECLKMLLLKNKKVSICLNEDELDNIKEYYSLLEEVILFKDFYNIQFNKYDYIIRSPGLSAKNEYIKYLKKYNIKIINEMELAYLLTNKKGYYIGITGSNGKSTTATLLYECLKKQTNNVLLAGNIGIPLISLIDKINNYTIIILEMSSFQLEDMHELKFDIALILNMSINHLDSVPSLEYYYKSKFNILNLQNTDNYFITNLNDSNINEYIKKYEINSKIIDYSKTILKEKDYILKGEHNILNVKAVVTVLNILGFSVDYSVIKEFNVLKYHLEEIKYKNFNIVNDSKSTTIEALKSAINAYKNKNIILIFGGVNKGADFSILNNYNLKEKICFGKLSNEVNCIVNYKNYYLENCIEYAVNKYDENDVILFSCGCSSFDLFNNYKERGEVFNNLIIKSIDKRCVINND